MRVKISLVLFGLFLSFFLIEGGLRIAGEIYILAHDKSYYFQGKETEIWDRDETFEVYGKSRERLTLAIGDSFTNGGNVNSDQSYPSQLFNLDKYNSVINLGRCESSTNSAFLRLKKFYDEGRGKPNYISILVGAADGFLPKPESEEEDTFVSIEPSSSFYELRTYKLYRYIKLGLKRKRLTDNLGKAWGKEKEISAISKVKEAMLKAFLDNSDIESTWEESHKKLSLDFLNYCERNKIYVDNPRGLLHASLVYLVKLYSSQGKHAKAFEVLFDFQNRLPEYFWSDFFQPARFFFYQTFQIQSEIDSKQVLQSFNKLITMKPKILKNENFTHLFNRFENWERQESEISERRTNNLTAMIKLAKKNGSQAIILSYPSPYKAANEDLKAVARNQKVPFLDLNSFFDNLVKESDRAKYFEDDDHLTPAGYKLMAQEVATLINGLD